MLTLVPDWFRMLVKAVSFISLFGVLVPLALGIWRWHGLSKSARIIVVYFAFWAVEAFVDLWIKHQKGSNFFLYHITVFVETWLLGYAYYLSVRSDKLRRWFLPAGLLFSAVALADAFVWSGLDKLNDYARSVQTAGLLACTLLYFEQWVREVRHNNPWWDFMFLLSVGLAVYYAGSVMSYLIMDSAKHDMGLDRNLTALIIDSTYVFAMTMMTLGLWRDGRTRSGVYLSEALVQQRPGLN
jgi:succinate dehydrogenase hydrophobic anchor subunit